MRRIALFGCMVVLAGACGDDDGATQSAAHRAAAVEGATDTPMPSFVPGPGASEAERLRKAILSIHAFVESHRPREGRLETIRELAGEFERMPLLDAANVLVEATDPFKASRIRRLAVRLLAHTRHEPEAIAAVKRMIGAAATADIVQNVEAVVAPGPPEPPEKLVSQAYALVVGPVAIGTCPRWQSWSDEDMAEESNDISIVVTADATPASFAQVRQGLDPQSWGACSKLWKRTHLVEMQGDEPVVVAGGSPKEKKEPLGEAWGAETLYEEFVCDDTSPTPPCDVKLLLDVTALEPAGSSSYRIKYENPRHFPGPPADPADVWVETDHGSVRATAIGADVEFKSTKTFGFADKTHSLMVLAWLYAIEEQSYLGELACCF